MADKFIAISGNIGVGKTSLVAYLSHRYGFQPVFEPFQDNPYLDDFYKDMKTWSFQSQAWFLAHKFRLHQEIIAREGTWIQDRTIYEDAEIFAKNLYVGRKMSARDFETYMEMYSAMKRSLQPPDLMIYLRCGVRAMRQRIKKRGRTSEQDIPARYLRRLNGLYEDWIGSYDASPVMIWESDSGDYLSDLVHRIEFHKAIERFL